MKIKNLSTCGLCTKGNKSTHLVLQEFRKSCPHNGANTKMYAVCDECVVDEQKALAKNKKQYKSIKVMQIIEGVYSDGLKTLEI